MNDRQKTSFKNIEDFYNENPRRRYSREADYGVNWRMEPWPHRWRVSYLQDTGEIYAVNLGRNHVPGPVIIMGVLQPDHEPQGFMGRETYYRTLDAVLDGYGDRCWEKNGLLWVMSRLTDAGPGDSGPQV